MKLISILSLTLLLTSCGLFKKTSTTFKQKDGALIVENLNVKKSTNTIETDQTVDKSEITSNEDETTKIYPKPNTKVEIKPDGSIIAEADSIVHATKRTRKKVNDILKNLSKQTKVNLDSVGKRKEETKHQVVDKAKTSKPDTLSLTVVYVIVGIVLVVVAIIAIKKLI